MKNKCKSVLLFLFFTLALVRPVYAEGAFELSPINGEKNLLKNYVDGYSIEVPKASKVVCDGNYYKTEISYGNTSFKIFIEDPSGKNFNYADYEYYSLKGLRDNQGEYEVLYDGIQPTAIGNFRAYQFNRQKLSAVENDKNHYLILIRNMGNNKFATFMIKSSNSINKEEVVSMVETFKMDVKTKEVPVVPVKQSILMDSAGQVQSGRVLSEDTSKLYYNDFLSAGSTKWGIFVQDFWRNTTMSDIEGKIDHKFKYALLYHSFSFNNEQIREAIKYCKTWNKTLEFTFQTDIVDGKNQIYSVLNGERDDSFREMARIIKEEEHPTLFRIGNEMNGDWCSYSAWNTGLDSDIYIAFYEHIYSIFEEEGANPYVLYVFNPNGRNFPDFKYNDESLYRPREDHYDILGLTLYNTGTYYSDEKWESFDELYTKLYRDSVKMYNKPMMITEFACSTVGGNKVEWTRDMLEKISTKYPKIKVAVWFNGIDLDAQGNPARVYKIDEPAEVLNVFKNHLK
ncbi:glycoside hydrolase family 26 protein [Anaerosphaera multitolerans]|uniref:GH26 domain-containing protein n=1 Tax=Anaerosphaera multitolerans TaxID=2487351 RepID=A0A437S7K1_9FIRM|nr:glycosyl hydrolase [Anaerosphaera multitolerans]RVU55059.1 hypothetical protein EF514_03995 [Anaerosphaera multitolerans]